MPTYATPGVYFERPRVRSLPAAALRTDVAGFVGIASRGPLHRAVRVDSPNRFTEIFGPATSEGYLAHAVQGFFANGGRRCWVVRVANRDASLVARWEVSSSDGRPAFELTARHPGTWAVRHMTVSTRRAGENRFHLLLRLADGHQEFWPNLSTDPDDKESFFETVINGRDADEQSGAGDDPADDGTDQSTQTAQGPTRSFLVRVSDTYVAGTRWNVAEGPGRPTDFGQDGLAELTPADFYLEKPGQERGLARLAKVDEISTVAMPDIMPPQRPTARRRLRPVACDCPPGPPAAPPREPSLLDRGSGRLGQRYVLPQPEQRPDFDEDQVQELQSELVRHCEKLRDRFAVLDAYPPQTDVQGVMAQRNRFTSKFAALYYPWIRVADPGGPPGSVRAVPPSGHVAGIYARVSLDPGVHKPPAGEVVEGAKDVVRFIGDSDHGALNDLGVNVIKPYDGRGIRVVGARTFSSDSDWRFVNVRRLVTMIEETIDEQLQWAVFEPHNNTLRRDVDRVIRSLLTNLWQQGMLDGTTADEAFGVTCDDSTNTQHDVDQGRMICQIVLNVPWPAEFVVVRIGIGDNGIRFVEGGGGNA